MDISLCLCLSLSLSISLSHSLSRPKPRDFTHLWSTHALTVHVDRNLQHSLSIYLYLSCSGQNPGSSLVIPPGETFWLSPLKCKLSALEYLERWQTVLLSTDDWNVRAMLSTIFIIKLLGKLVVTCCKVLYFTQYNTYHIYHINFSIQLSLGCLVQPDSK